MFISPDVALLAKTLDTPDLLFLLLIWYDETASIFVFSKSNYIAFNRHLIAMSYLFKLDYLVTVLFCIQQTMLE